MSDHITIACADPLTGKTEYRKIECEKIGMLAVHQATTRNPDGDWMITHIPTGYGVFRRKTKASARKAARDLARLPCWDFHDVSAVKSIPSEYMAVIKAIKARV